jgi:signal transduction histidine kinase
MKMNRLFWKIFGSFLSMIVTLLVVTVCLEWFIPLEPPEVSHQALMREALKDEAYDASQALKRGGADALNQELEEFETRAQVQAFWLNAQGEEPPETALTAPTVTPVVRDIARQAGQSVGTTPTLFRVVGLSLYAAAKAPTPNAVLVIRLSRVGATTQLSSRLFRLALAIVVACAACWLLARNLVAPLEALRAASRRLASGDLAARVSPAPPKRRRDEIGLLSRDFDAMAGQLELLVDAQKRLLRDVSHELRSPLTRLRLTLSLMNRETPEELRTQLAPHQGRIEAEISALDTLIGELLALSRLENRLESGVALEGETEFDLVECVREIATETEWEARQLGKTVRVRVECETEKAPVPGQKGLMRRALQNLASNALRYLPSEGEIDFAIGHFGGMWSVRVRDNGPGVSDEKLEAIFRPFYRANEDADQQRSGLGLAIARRAVEFHGGSLTARNVKPHGLEMSILVPIPMGPK